MSPVPETLLASHFPVDELYCNICPLLNEPVVTSVNSPMLDAPPQPDPNPVKELHATESVNVLT